VQAVVSEVGQSGKQRAVDSRSLPHRVQLGQAPVAVLSETVGCVLKGVDIKLHRLEGGGGRFNSWRLRCDLLENLNNHKFYVLPTQYIYVFMWISEQIAIISLYNIT
jgi:hypothetical protein